MTFETFDVLEYEYSDEGQVPEANFISPPGPGVLTDEDSGEEDFGGRADNLTSRQLLAPAEVYRNLITGETKFSQLVSYNKRNWLQEDLKFFWGHFRSLNIML